MMRAIPAVVAALVAAHVTAFVPSSIKRRSMPIFMTGEPIVSPFDDSNAAAASSSSAPTSVDDGPLDLTWENVELVLDEMRHYLIQDGGNVAIQEIDGPVVKLELQVRSNVGCSLRVWIILLTCPRRELVGRVHRRHKQ